MSKLVLAPRLFPEVIEYQNRESTNRLEALDLEIVGGMPAGEHEVLNQLRWTTRCSAWGSPPVTSVKVTGVMG